MNRDLPKLVRDKSQKLYPDNTYRKVTGHDEWQLLFEKKIQEELIEVGDAAINGNYEQLVEECADLTQAVSHFFQFLKVDPMHIAVVCGEKEEHRGGFNDGLVLEECTLWEGK